MCIKHRDDFPHSLSFHFPVLSKLGIYSREDNWREMKGILCGIYHERGGLCIFLCIHMYIFIKISYDI